MGKWDPFQDVVEREICKEAAEQSKGRVFLTDPAVEQSKDDHIELPSYQTQEDTREFCGMHQV